VGDDPIAKNRAVDEAWELLKARGIDKDAWLNHQKWRGNAGKAKGKGSS